jgi:hemolysin III
MAIVLIIQSFWGIREPVSALSHGLATVLSAIVIVVLIRRARTHGLSRSKHVGLWAFGGSMMLLYGASTLFHWLQVPEGQLALLNKIDHAGVFLFIAGTMIAVYSIVECKIEDSGYWVQGALVLAAVAGLLNLFFFTTPRWFTTGLYLTLGWAGSVGVVQIASTSSDGHELRLFFYGLGIYTLAAVMFVAQWPVVWSGYVESHELFHLMVMIGSALHFRYIYRYCTDDPGGRNSDPRKPAFG